MVLNMLKLKINRQEAEELIRHEDKDEDGNINF